LVELVTQAQLVETLSAGGPWTVFAPSDEAFLETITALTSRNGLELPLDTDLVSTLLTYHVVEGIYPASAIEDGLQLETVQGEMITFGLSDAGATVNGEGIVITDVLANNGIVHVVDGVLIPQAATDMLEGDAMPTAPTMPAAPSMADPAPSMSPTDAPAASGFTVGVVVAASLSVVATLLGM
jgi:Fasciclin domain